MNINYTPPWYIKNAHLQIILKEVFTKAENVNYNRETLSLEDGDFIDLDWLKKSTNNLVIISHGLEGSSERPYVKSLAKYLYQNNFDVLAWNMRGCSGKLNRLPKFYHSGFTEDLKDIIEHVNRNYNYKNIFLTGFSVGGNITLKYLGEGDVPINIKKSICFSVPIDLLESSKELAKCKNQIYMKYFLDKLKPKILEKAKQHKKCFNIEGIDKIKNFLEFDNQFTAPLNGFKDVYDYYEKASSKNFLHNIKVESLLISAEDDPFLNHLCFPEHIKNSCFSFALTKYGSHMAYIGNKKNWINQVVIKFLNEK